MKKSEYILKSLPNALGVFAYVSLLSWGMFNAEHVFGDKPDNFLMPVLMLMLLVVSAAVTGSLVLAKPLSLFLSGAKKEAYLLLMTTLAWLAVFIILVATILSR